MTRRGIFVMFLISAKDIIAFILLVGKCLDFWCSGSYSVGAFAPWGGGNPAALPRAYPCVLVSVSWAPRPLSLGERGRCLALLPPWAPRPSPLPRRGEGIVVVGRFRLSCVENLHQTRRFWVKCVADQSSSRGRRERMSESSTDRLLGGRWGHYAPLRPSATS